MKIYLLTFILTSVLFSCSHTSKPKKPAPKPVQEEFKAMNVEAYNGFAKKVLVDLPAKITVTDLVCDEMKVGFDRTDKGLRVYLSVPYKYQKENMTCELTSQEFQPFNIINITVKKYPYREEFLKVPKKHVDLKPEDVKRWQGEVKKLKEVYSASILDRALFTTPFERPLKSKVTSTYGNRRVFNNKKDSWHSGVDFRARTPTKIPSANRGKVVFVGDLFFNGKTVIIDHGLGIFTMYCHLSKITSQVGEIVPKGAIVGISGNTGRSNAPHLHWGVKVSGNWVNGLSLIDQGI